MGFLADLLARLAAMPPLALYLFIGLGAATENVVPPVPADTFVLFGAFLAAAGRADAWTVFFVTWGANVASALGVYGVAHVYGRRAFATPFGRWLLHPRQMEQIARFYSRWGTTAIFVSRFLPAFRAIVPIFAGVSHMSFWRVAPPLALASAAWYGLLVYIGAFAGRNWAAILSAFEQVSGIVLWLAVPLLLALVIWWWLTRRGDE